jgi:hypothetical protein
VAIVPSGHRLAGRTSVRLSDLDGETLPPGRDIVLLLSAPTSIATPIASTRPDLWRRYLHLILDALRPETAHPLPAAAPTIQDFTSASTA